MRCARSERAGPREQPPMSTHLRPIVITVAVMMCGLWAVADAAAQIPFLHRGRVEYRAFNDPGGRFAFEFPDGWQPVPGAGDVIASFSQPDGEAAIVLARFQMNQALAAD